MDEVIIEEIVQDLRYSLSKRSKYFYNSIKLCKNLIIVLACDVR